MFTSSSATALLAPNDLSDESDPNRSHLVIAENSADNEPEEELEINAEDILELSPENEPSAENMFLNLMHELYADMLSMLMRGSVFVCNHYIIFITALIAAFATSVFAFYQPLNASETGITMSEWNALPAPTQAHAIINWADTLVVYTIFNSSFIEAAYLKLKIAMPGYFQNGRNLVGSMLTATLAAFAGTANAAISYSGYQRVVGPQWAFLPCITTFVTIFASRFVSLGILKTRASNYFDADLQLQKDSIIQLQRLDHQSVYHINSWLEGRELNEETYIALFNELAREMSVFPPVKMSELVSAASSIGFDSSMSLIAMVSTYLLFAQKGFDGMVLLASIFGGQLRNANRALQIFLSSIPGIVSSVFMTLNSGDFRQIIVDTIAYLRYHPKVTPLVLLILVMNVWTAISGFGHIAFETIGPDNIFGLSQAEGMIGQLYVAGNIIACIPVTIAPMLKMIYISEKPANPHATALEKIIHWADPSRHRVSPESISQLRNLSFFSRRPSSSIEQDSTASLLAREAI